MNSKVLDLESMNIIKCVECGSDSLRGKWNGPEEYIDLECHECGVTMTDKKTREGVFKSPAD